MFTKGGEEIGVIGYITEETAYISAAGKKLKRLSGRRTGHDKVRKASCRQMFVIKKFATRGLSF